jgi:CheY-like chemotaxis protein
VDNEETDRRLLVDLLAPLGFAMQQAASGEAALALLAALPREQRPQAILLDLAMPGIDGWTTLARLREQGLSDAPVAIVSANAFDKLLLAESAAAALPPPGRGEVSAADFFVKPVRLAELLDWLSRRLRPAAALDDTAAPPNRDPVVAPLVSTTPDPSPMSALVPASSTTSVPTPATPTPERLLALRAALDLGHVRGVLGQLDALEAEAPAWSAFAAQARALARGFQLDAMARLLSQAEERSVARG